MLAKREKGLLAVLAAVVSLSVLGIAFAFGEQRLSAAEASAARYQMQNEKLRRSIGLEKQEIAERDRLRGELMVLRTHFYAQNEMDPYSFGTIIKKKLGSLGLNVVRYQVIDVKGASSLEFSVSGSIRSLVPFLKDVSDADRYWTIPSLTLTMREGTGEVDAVFRIGYEVRDQ